MGSHVPIYTEVTLAEQQRRILDDIDAFARADAWDDEPARALPPSPAQPAPAGIRRPAGATRDRWLAHGETPRQPAPGPDLHDAA